MANQTKNLHYKQAPLPFVGQKRMFLNAFKQVLNDNIPNDGEGWTIIDTFGGSGLLSHVAKRIKPKARVIYNDFDGYADRLKHINDTNRLRAELLQVVGDIIPKDKRLDNNKKQEIINKINSFKGFKDLNTIASWLLFSGCKWRLNNIKNPHNVGKIFLKLCGRVSHFARTASMAQVNRENPQSFIYLLLDNVLILIR